jgi:hypothetical protein
VSIPGRGNSSKRPDGKPSGQVVSFTRGAADRIAKVVRTVERGDTSAEGLRFGRPVVQGAKVDSFRVCTFTGEWTVETPKQVTFKNQTTTPNTLTAINLIAKIPVGCVDGTATRDVLVAKAGTAWYYVTHERECDGQYPATELDEGASCNSSASQVSSGDGPDVLFNDQGCAKWVQLSRIEVVTDVSWSNGIFVQKQFIWAFADPSQGNGQQIIGATTCP